MSLSVFRLVVVLTLCIALIAMPSLVMASGGDAHSSGDHAPAGLPMDWKADLALFSLITFVVYLLVLKVGAWGPLQAGLNAREQRIRQDIANAESNRLKSEAMVKEHEVKLNKVQEEVREILAEARRDAEHTKQEIISVAQAEADAAKKRSIAEIERARDQALAELFDAASSNVIGATERVIGRSLQGSDHDRLVRDALAELSSRRN